MTSQELDIELFIEEVKKYREIWDLSSEAYRDRNLKRASWIKICEIFYEDFKKKSDKEKNEIGNALMIKWKNIRDSYTKNKKKYKSGQAANAGRFYMYAKQLAFLTHSGCETNTQDSIVTEIQDEIDTENAATSATSSSPVSNTTRRKIHLGTTNYTEPKRQKTLEASLINFMNTPIPNCSKGISSEATDDDKSFFDSLLPAVRQFTLDEKLGFRSEVIQIIKNIRSQKENLIPSHSSAQINPNVFALGKTAPPATLNKNIKFGPSSSSLPLPRQIFAKNAQKPEQVICNRPALIRINSNRIITPASSIAPRYQYPGLTKLFESNSQVLPQQSAGCLPVESPQNVSTNESESVLSLPDSSENSLDDILLFPNS